MARVAPGTHNWGTDLNRDLDELETKADEAQESVLGFRAELQQDVAEATAVARQAVAAAEDVMLTVTRAGVINADALAPFYEKLANAGSERVRIGIVASDSTYDGPATTFDRTAPMQLQRMLRELTGTTGGIGYVPATPSTQGAIVAPVPNTRSGSAVMWSHGLGGRAMYLNQAGHHVTYSPQVCTSAQVRYGKTTTAGGGLRVEIDGVDQGVTLSSVGQPPSGGGPAVNSGGHVWTSPPLSPGEHVVRVVPSTPPYVGILEGVEFFNGDESKGVVVYNGAHSGGSTTSYLTANMGLHWQSVEHLDLDLALVVLGINDLHSLTPAQFLTGIDTIHTSKVPAGVPILNVGPYLRGDKADDPSEVADWAVMKAGLAARASGRVAYVDKARWWPDLKPDGSTSAGLMFDNPPIHPNNAGMERFAKILTAVLRPATVGLSVGTGVGGSGNTVSVRYNTATATWPPRPPAAEFVMWLGGTPATPPPGAASGADTWIFTDSAGGDPDPEPDPDPGSSPGSGSHRMGWELTAANTGLSSKGVTPAMLTPGTVPYYGGGLTPTVTTNQHRKKFVIAGHALAPGAGVVFTECSFEGPSDLISALGSCTFIDCDFHITEAAPMSENVHVFGHPYFAGPDAVLTMTNCRMTGGHMFANVTLMSAVLTNVYGYAQSPEVGGGQHRDGFTSRGAIPGKPIKLIGCRFDCNQTSTTGAFFLQDTYGDGVHGVEAIDCLFEGSGYVMTFDRVHGTKIDNCRTNPYGPHAYSDYTLGSSGPSTFDVWTNNHRYANNPANGYKGAALPEPVYAP